MHIRQAQPAWLTQPDTPGVHLVDVQDNIRTCNAGTSIHLHAAPAVPVAAALRVKGLARLFVEVGVERHHLILVTHAPACNIRIPLALGRSKLFDETLALHTSSLSVPQ